MNWNATLRDSLRSRRILILAAALSVAWGTAAAVQQTWTGDDAFISFRYARNLVEGRGLVFNEGEYVEGFTNFLWTLWSAFGLALGFTAEYWAHFWSVAAYVASILVLLIFHLRLRQSAGAFPLPAAAILAAFHHDWNVYATSGLETSLFTFLLLAAFLAVTDGELSCRRLASTGLLTGAAFLTRPEGFLPAFVIGLFVLWKARRRIKSGLVYGSFFAVLAGPFILWRLWYYGDLFPNTYYAKSAWLAWYSQGWIYVSLYFQRYWPLLLGPLLLATVVWRRRSAGGRRRSSQQSAAASPPIAGENADLSLGVSSQDRRTAYAVLALALALPYTFYVVRVGGDFMFARMLIPATPFYLILVELGLTALPARFPLLRLSALAVAWVGMVFTPAPVTDEHWVSGIADERLYYSEERVAAIEHKADVLERFFKGLPVRLAYLGANARVAYRARIPVVIDCYGLTDRTIALQPLKERGRVGHEKRPEVAYLADRRQTHFIFHPNADSVLKLGDSIPVWPIRLAEIEGRLLHWDPELMSELKRRGARFEDFPAFLDRYLEGMDQIPRAQVETDFAKFRLFYFDHVDDPRESDLRRRLQ